MTALEVLQNTLEFMDLNGERTLDKALSLVIEGAGCGIPDNATDKAIELLAAYVDPFDTDTPTHRLYGRLYRWCRSVTLETQRDAVVWAIGVLEGCKAHTKPIRTADGREADAEDVRQWLERR